MSSRKLDPVNQIHVIVAGLASILVGVSLFVGDALIPKMVIPGAVLVVFGLIAVCIAFLRFPNLEKSWNHAPVPPAAAPA